MAALLRQLGAQRALVMGHDWGAAVAWALALAEPQCVERLVVLSVGHPGAGTAVDPPQRAAWWYQLFFALPGAEAALRVDDWALLRQVMGPSVSSGQLQAYINRLDQPGALAGALGWYRANTRASNFGATTPLPPAAGRVAVPVLAVWSDRDTALREPQMLASARYVADGCWTYVRLGGVGHWIPRDAPRALNTALLAWLRDGGGGGGGARPRL